MRDYDLLAYEDAIIEILEDRYAEDIEVWDNRIYFSVNGVNFVWSNVEDTDSCEIESINESASFIGSNVYDCKNSFDMIYDALTDIQALIYGD